MTDLSTTYLGLPLASPLVPSASPLAHDLDTIPRMEDAGAAAVVLPSLFAEQLADEIDSLLTHGTYTRAEADAYLPEASASPQPPTCTWNICAAPVRQWAFPSSPASTASRAAVGPLLPGPSNRLAPTPWS
jgi:hypothetical protein